MVIAAGLAAIAWINWYFFLAGRQTATAAAGAGGVQEVTITVHGGYDPAEVRLKRGVPAVWCSSGRRRPAAPRGRAPGLRNPQIPSAFRRPQSS